MEEEGKEQRHKYNLKDEKTYLYSIYQSFDNSDECINLQIYSINFLVYPIVLTFLLCVFFFVLPKSCSRQMISAFNDNRSFYFIICRQDLIVTSLILDILHAKEKK